MEKAMPLPMRRAQRRPLETFFVVSAGAAALRLGRLFVVEAWGQSYSGLGSWLRWSTERRSGVALDGAPAPTCPCTVVAAGVGRGWGVGSGVRALRARVSAWASAAAARWRAASAREGRCEGSMGRSCGLRAIECSFRRQQGLRCFTESSVRNTAASPP